MDNYTKAGSRELPTYQADLALPQTQAKIEVNGLFYKIQLAIVHLFPPSALGTQMAASSLNGDAHTGSLVPGWLCPLGRKPHLHSIKGNHGIIRKKPHRQNTRGEDHQLGAGPLGAEARRWLPPWHGLPSQTVASGVSPLGER